MPVYTFPFNAETIVVDLEIPPYRLFRDLKIEITRTLMQGIEYLFLSGVEGHIAEFGTATGLTATSLAMALTKAKSFYAHIDRMHGISNRNLYLFDSFQGLPQARSGPDQQAPHVISGIWGKGACKALNAVQLMDMVSGHTEKDSIHIFEGWYQDTLPQIEKGVKFALVHLDCDLYESTFQVLDYLLANNHLSNGCLLFFDDWNCNHGSTSFGQRRAWEECVEKYRPHYEHLGNYGCMSHKILLHSPASVEDEPAEDRRFAEFASELKHLADKQTDENKSLLTEMTDQLTRYQKIVANLEKELMTLKNDIGSVKTGGSTVSSPCASQDPPHLDQSPNQLDLINKINSIEQELALQGNRNATYKKRIQNEMETFTENFQTEIQKMQKELKRFADSYESHRRIDRQVLESFQESYKKDKDILEEKMAGLQHALKK